MFSCCLPLWKRLKAEQAARRAKVAAENSSRSDIRSSFAKAAAQTKAWDAKETSEAHRALALLVACDTLPLSLGEKRWFQFYSRRLSRGKYTPVTHSPVMKHVALINKMDIEPALKAELEKVRDSEAAPFSSFRTGHSVCCHHGPLDVKANRRLSWHHSALHQQELGADGGAARQLSRKCAHGTFVQCLLAFKKLEGSHTAEKVAAAIQEALDTVGEAKAKLSALNADGASNAQGAISEFEGT